MRKRWLLNLALLALVGALALVVTLRHARDQESAAAALAAIDAGAVERIRVALSGQPESVLERRRGQWWLVAPRRARANEFKVGQLLQLGSAASELRLSVDPKDLLNFGLAPPQARVWLGTEEIEIGDTHPFKGARYVRHRDSVYLVPMLLAPGSYRASALVSPRLLAPEYRLVEIALPRLTLRHERDRWLVQPTSSTLSADQISTLVNDWQRAQAFAVAPYSGRPIRDRVRLAVRDASADEQAATNLTLGILSESPEFVLYREDEGLEYRFTEDTGKRLLNLGSE